MNHAEIPEVILDLFDGLESSPNEAVRRFAGLSRWRRRGRAPKSLDAFRAEMTRAMLEEIARVLVEFAGLLLFADPSCRDLFHRSVRLGESLQQPSRSECHQAARALLERARFLSVSGIDEELTALSTMRTAAVDRLRVVLLAWRLCPMDRVALHAAIEYRLRGEWQAAQRFLQAVSERPTSRLSLSYAWETQAALCIARGDLGEAAGAFRRSFDLEQSRPAPATSFLVTSLILGARSQAEDAARAIEHLSPEPSEVLSVVRCFRALRARGILKAVLDGEVARWGSRLGAHATTVIHALS